MRPPPATRRRAFGALTHAALAVLACAPAHATVTSCVVSAGGVAFGLYDPTSPGALPSSGTITVNCTVPNGNNPVTIALSAGFSGSFGTRTMSSGLDTLSYNLYLDAAHSQVWGDGTGGSVTDTQSVTHGKPSFSATVYGLMPASQNAAAGSYNDTITVTVNY
jgi:spore coat protein U domain-containing protein, fimbrial subunit CupE1/2/3/6